MWYHTSTIKSIILKHLKLNHIHELFYRKLIIIKGITFVLSKRVNSDACLIWHYTYMRSCNCQSSFHNRGCGPGCTHLDYFHGITASSYQRAGELFPPILELQTPWLTIKLFTFWKAFDQFLHSGCTCWQFSLHIVAYVCQLCNFTKKKK